MDVYHYDSVTGAFLGTSQADLSPLDNEWLIPAHATELVPPAAPTGQVAVFDGSAWGLLDDTVGQQYWLPDGSTGVIEEYGQDIPVGAVLVPPPSQFYKLQDGVWVFDGALLDTAPTGGRIELALEAAQNGETSFDEVLQWAVDQIEVSEAQSVLDLGGREISLSSSITVDRGNVTIQNAQITVSPDWTGAGTGTLGENAVFRVRTGTRITLRDIKIDCAGLADGIVCETSGFYNEYIGNEINNFKDYGILLTEDSAGGQSVENCRITQNNLPSLRTGTGLEIRIADAKIWKNILRYSACNLRIAKGASATKNPNTTMFQNNHLYNGYIGSDPDEAAAAFNSVNIHVKDGSGAIFTGNYLDKGRIYLEKFANIWTANKLLFLSDGTGHESCFVLDAGADTDRLWPDGLELGFFDVGAPFSNGIRPFIELVATGGGSWDSSVSTTVSKLLAESVAPTCFGQNSVLLPGGSGRGSIGTDQLRWGQIHGIEGNFNRLTLRDHNPITEIAGGEITASDSFHRVETEGKIALSNLTTINGGQPGQMLVLTPVNASRTVVLQHNTGNIFLKGEADLSLTKTQHHIVLIYNHLLGNPAGGTGLWCQL